MFSLRGDTPRAQRSTNHNDTTARRTIDSDVALFCRWRDEWHFGLKGRFLSAQLGA
jgi:hypothetical protein